LECDEEENSYSQTGNKTLEFLLHSCTLHLGTIKSFIYPTDAQPDCSKRMLQFTLKFT
jgi:hypothetical protein